MIDPAALPPSDLPQDLGDPALARRQHELAGLEELADMALVLCRRFQAAAIAACDTAQTPPEMAAAERYGRAFDRTARTYRQCLALKDRLANTELARKAKTAALAQAGETWDSPYPPPIVYTPYEIATRGAQVRGAVQVAILAADRTPVEREQLLADLNEHLASEGDLALTWGEVSSMVWRYCQMLHLPFEIDLWADTDWAREEMQTQPLNSPYIGYQAKDEAASSLPLAGRGIAYGLGVESLSRSGF